MTFLHKTNESDTKLSAHYWIICLYFINISCDIFVVYDCFTFKYIQCVPIDSNPSRFITYTPSFILGKLFLELTRFTFSVPQGFCLLKIFYFLTFCPQRATNYFSFCFLTNTYLDFKKRLVTPVSLCSSRVTLLP